MGLKHEWCGWGLAIILSAFIINFVIDGVRFSFGILFEVFTNTFGKDANTTAWVGSLMFSVMNFGGPICSISVSKFGCRMTTIIGSLICFAGFIMSAYVPNLYFLYFSLGVLVGFGMSLMFVSQTVILLRYFKDNRTLAVGISICGSGLGGSSFTFLLSILSEMYSWNSLMMILSGILLQTTIAGMLMRPKKIPNSEQFMLKEDGDRIKDKGSHSLDTDKKSQTLSSVENGYGLNSVSKQNKNIVNHEKDTISAETECNSHVKSVGTEKTNDKCFESNIDTSTNQIKAKAGYEHKDKKDDKSTDQSERSILTIVSIYSDLLKDAKVHLFLGSQLCIGVVLMVPFTFIPRVAMDKGHSNYQAVWMLSGVNISNIVCRLLIGFLADRKFVNRSYLYTFAILVIAVAGLGFALFDEYEILLISSCAIGAGVGLMITLFPVVMTDIFGEKRTSEVFGLSIFSRGPGNLFGPPLAGYLIDTTGSSSHVFFLFTGVMTMGTLLTVVFVYIHTRQLKKMTNLSTKH